MVGRADPRGVPLDSHTKMTWNNDGNFGVPDMSPWSALQPQTSHSGPHLGPEASLRVGDRAHFIKFAMGSTKIREHWHPESGAHYQRFLDFVRTSISSVPPAAKLCGMFWFQGESDTGAAKTANTYREDLIHFVTKLRSDLCEPEMPFVAQQVVWKGKKLDIVNRAISAACDELQMATWVSAEGLTVADDEHLDTASVLAVGERMSNAFTELLARSHVTQD